MNYVILNDFAKEKSFSSSKLAVITCNPIADESVNKNALRSTSLSENAYIRLASVLLRVV